MTGSGKPGKHNPRFPPFPLPLEILPDSHIHTAPTFCAYSPKHNTGRVGPTFTGKVGPNLVDITNRVLA